MSSTGRVPLLDENDRFPDRFAPPSVAADAAAAEAARDESVAAAVSSEAVPAQVDTAMAEQVGTGGEFDTKLNATIGTEVAAVVPGEVALALAAEDMPAQAAAAAASTAVAARIQDGTIATAAASNHLTHRANVRRAKGGVIGTGGRPAVCFRIDHGVDDFLALFWPLFRERGIPVSLGVITDTIGNPSDPYEPTSTTWPQLRAAVREGIEVWSHSATHRDPVETGKTLHYEIVEAADRLEAEKLRVMGWHKAGIPGGQTPNYSNEWHGDFNHEPGQLMLSRFGLFETSILGGQYRFLPLAGDSYGLGRYTLDSRTVTEATTYLDTARALGASVQFMIHPLFIAEARVPWTVADMAEFLDYVLSLWDAGEIEVLTPAGMVFADPATDRRLDLLRDGRFQRGTLEAPWFVTSPGNGATTIMTDGGRTGPNYVRMPSTGSFSSVAQDTPSNLLAAAGLQGGTFLCETWVRCTGPDTNVRVTVRDATDTARLNLSPQYLLTEAQGWQRIRVPFTLHPDTTTLRVMVGRTQGSGVIDIDEIRAVVI